ncbi:CoA pyrophosphatase [Phaeospirillum tilakii]|uniref:CoA pyrophosphatase n=1 Tax=Phaeospirillum tilakii TaxID=741673 RepID=A0ABW5C6B7_9PROT
MSVETIARRLAARPPGGLRRTSPSDDDDLAAMVPAAVLLPLIDHPGAMTVLLTRRTAHLAHHPGQISFPGGRLEPEDDGDAVTCALRETCEEVGLPPGRVRVLGRLDPLATGTGFLIQPVVGLVRPPVAFTPDPFEVADLIELPLAFALDPANHQGLTVEREGRLWSGWRLAWGDAVIWGATAAMLVNLSEVLLDGPA